MVLAREQSQATTRTDRPQVWKSSWKEQGLPSMALRVPSVVQAGGFPDLQTMVVKSTNWIKTGQNHQATRPEAGLGRQLWCSGFWTDGCGAQVSIPRGRWCRAGRVPARILMVLSSWTFQTLFISGLFQDEGPSVPIPEAKGGHGVKARQCLWALLLRDRVPDGDRMSGVDTGWIWNKYVARCDGAILLS